MVTKISENHTASICRAEVISILKMEAAPYSDKLIANQKATRYHNPEYQPLIQWVLGGLALWVKWLGHEADNSTPSSAKVKNGGAIPPLTIRHHGVVLN
jgi:hypothetical protein